MTTLRGIQNWFAIFISRNNNNKKVLPDAAVLSKCQTGLTFKPLPPDVNWKTIEMEDTDLCRCLQPAAGVEKIHFRSSLFLDVIFYLENTGPRSEIRLGVLAQGR